MFLEIVRYFYWKLFPRERHYTKTEIAIKLFIWLLLITFLLFFFFYAVDMFNQS